jgi:hypothetical protein
LRSSIVIHLRFAAADHHPALTSKKLNQRLLANTFPRARWQMEITCTMM